MKVMWELCSAVAQRTVLWCQTAWVSDSTPLLNQSLLYVSSTLGRLFNLFQISQPINTLLVLMM